MGQKIKESAKRIRCVLGLTDRTLSEQIRLPPGRDVNERTQNLFDMQSRLEHNHMMVSITVTNRKVLRVVQWQLEQLGDIVRKEVVRTFTGDTSRADKQDTCAGLNEYMFWEEVIACELRMSNVAMQRVALARVVGEAREELRANKIETKAFQELRYEFFSAYESLREKLRHLTHQVRSMTGNNDFYSRHAYEIWDLTGW
jgi:hypothetical protein